MPSSQSPFAPSTTGKDESKHDIVVMSMEPAPGGGMTVDTQNQSTTTARLRGGGIGCVRYSRGVPIPIINAYSRNVSKRSFALNAADIAVEGYLISESVTWPYSKN